MFSCRGTIDVSIDSPRRCDDTRLFAFLGSAKNLACVFKSCESKSKGKKKRKIGREIKRLLETTFRLWREKFAREDWFGKGVVGSRRVRGSAAIGWLGAERNLVGGAVGSMDVTWASRRRRRHEAHRWSPCSLAVFRVGCRGSSSP